MKKNKKRKEMKIVKKLKSENTKIYMKKNNKDSTTLREDFVD